jgi:hypothetical protein
MVWGRYIGPTVYIGWQAGKMAIHQVRALSQDTTKRQPKNLKSLVQVHKVGIL